MSESDLEIAAAYTRLLHEPAVAKVMLTDYEFKMVCEAPIVYEKFGGFTWKQRRLLREIGKKLGVLL